MCLGRLHAPLPSGRFAVVSLTTCEARARLPQRRGPARVSVLVVIAPVVVLDPCFEATDAAALVDLCERFGRYRMYAELEPLDTEIGQGLAPRHDALMNFLRTGGLGQTQESPGALGVRTSYFREEYAYGRDERIDGIGRFLYHEPFLEAARSIHGRAVVEPAIAYANLMVPGQELAVHTDVPEYRGANRKVVPQWLLVVMHHSGLFADWRKLPFTCSRLPGKTPLWITFLYGIGILTAFPAVSALLVETLFVV